MKIQYLGEDDLIEIFSETGNGTCIVHYYELIHLLSLVKKIVPVACSRCCGTGEDPFPMEDAVSIEVCSSCFGSRIE